VIRYAEAHPRELSEAFARGAAAVAPFGALEWHGEHLPLGLDGIVAEAFSERLAGQIDAVLLPTNWNAMTTLPNVLSLSVRASAFTDSVDDLVLGLYGAGARTVCIVSGHYAQGQEVVLYRSAVRNMRKHGRLRVLAGSPLEPIGDDALLDHAARIETAQLLALRPDLARLERLSENPSPKRDAVLGENPARATAHEGEALLETGLVAWSEWIASASRRSLFAHYRRAEKRYEPYVRRYFRGSWERAIRDWWATK